MAKTLRIHTKSRHKRKDDPGQHCRAIQADPLIALLTTLQEGIIVYDLEGKISHLNAAAARLFAVSSVDECIGTPSRLFFTRYRLWDEQHQPLSLDQMLAIVNPSRSQDITLHEHSLFFQIPPGPMIEVQVSCTPLYDVRHHLAGSICVFHDVTERRQQEQYLQEVSTALLELAQKLPYLPESTGLIAPEEPLLLPPELQFVTQQLVNLLHHHLNCRGPALFSISPQDGSLSYVVGGGLTDEEEQLGRNNQRQFRLTDFFDASLLASLHAKREVIIARDQLLTQQGPFVSAGSSARSENWLIVPLFLQGHLAGALVLGKDPQSMYTPKEITVIKAITELSVLVIECVRSLYEWSEAQARMLLLQENNHRINTFLNMASHELKTPLTTIMGNLQLVLRRLQRTEKTIAENSELDKRNLHDLHGPLEAAYQSACVQEHIINDMINDALVQTNTLTLHLKRCDITTLVQEALTARSIHTSERIILQNRLREGEAAPVLADVDRIKQAVITYVTNALNYSPADQPIQIELQREQTLVRVAVTSAGPGISPEEGEHVWDRFYRAKGLGVQHELELSFGLGLYLCREFILRHHGEVGLSSIPNQGSTFWFTLPILATPVG